MTLPSLFTPCHQSRLSFCCLQVFHNPYNSIPDKINLIADEGYRLQTSSDKGIPVCGRGLAGMRLEETDEMLGIFEAEMLADHCDGQRLVVQQLFGMGEKVI